MKEGGEEEGGGGGRESPAPTGVFHVHTLTPPPGPPALPKAAANPQAPLCPVPTPFLAL